MDTEGLFSKALLQTMRSMVTEALAMQVPTMCAAAEKVARDVMADLPQLEKQDPNRLLRVEEVGELLGSSPAAVRAMMRDGRLPYLMIKGTKDRRVPYGWLVEFIYQQPKRRMAKIEKERAS